MPDSETTGDMMRRATSCSGWTEPRYNGISVAGILLHILDSKSGSNVILLCA